MLEILKAIALLCSTHGAAAPERIDLVQRECQKQLVSCVGDQQAKLKDVLPLPQSLAVCVIKRGG